MNNIKLFSRIFVVWMCACLCSGCDADMHNEKIYLYESISNIFPDYVKQYNITDLDSDLERIIEGKWEFPIKIQNSIGNSGYVVDNCNAYFDACKQKIIPVLTQDRSAYSKRGLFCIFVKLLQSQNANFTIKEHDESLAIEIVNNLPSDVSYIIKDNGEVTATGNWMEADSIQSITKNNNELILESESEIHFVTLLASGDFDNDNIDEHILIITHAVKDGTHFIDKMYMVTKEHNGKRYRILKDFNDCF